MAISSILDEPRHLGERGAGAVRRAMSVGVLGIVIALAGAALGVGWKRFFFAWVCNFAFVLSLCLGALFLVLLHHLTRSGWSVVLRRLLELVAGALPWLAVLFVPVLVGIHEVYHWSDAALVAADPVLRGKAAYLNVPFFVARWVVYFLIWGGLSRWYLRRSVLQDSSGELGPSVLMEKRSAPAMLGLALTSTFAAFDLLMSIDAHWYSTIFGVYFFSGSVVGVVALTVLLARLVQGAGLLRRAITVEHFHDLGKLLFAFTVFWAYIAFSQFMLYWYANIPEETSWFLRRQSNGWGWVSLVLVFGHFLLPFVIGLFRAPKRRPAQLAVIAAWMLVMHWVDLYWLVIPEVSPTNPLPTVVDAGALLAVGGLTFAVIAAAARRVSLIPERDPRLGESLAFENA